MKSFTRLLLIAMTFLAVNVSCFGATTTAEESEKVEFVFQDIVSIQSPDVLVGLNANAYDYDFNESRFFLFDNLEDAPDALLVLDVVVDIGERQERKQKYTYTYNYHCQRPEIIQNSMREGTQYLLRYRKARDGLNQC